jgi:DHA2 family metal-tetracycline-proton antiporter-like MFS transporter
METELQAALPRAEAPAAFREGLTIALWSFVVILVVMNTTMFNVALPQVAADFALQPTAASWIVVGYSIVFAIASITYSRLSDYVPIRTLMLAGQIALGAGSLLGLLGHGFVPLLIARLLQAAGAAAAPGLGIVLITRYVPLARRGRAMSAIMSAASLGFGLGPVAGGAITQYAGWHWLFAVTAVALLTVPVLFRLLPKEQPQKVVFDFLGALAIGLGTTCLLLFPTLHSVTALVLGLLALAAFALRIRKAGQPFVQPALFGNGRYMLLIAMGFAAYVANFATLYMLPLILVRVFDKSSAAAGLLMFPGAMLSALLSRQIGKLIDKYGNMSLLRLGLPLLIAAVVLFALLCGTSSYALMVVFMLLSVAVTALTTSVSNEMSRILPKEQIGAGMGLSQLTQFIGGAFGVALTGAALVWQQALPLGQSFSNIYWGIGALVLLAALGCLRYAALQKRLTAA